MSAADNKRIAIAMHESIGNGDIDGAFANMTDDVTFRPMGTHPVGREFKGKEDIVNNLFMTVFAKLDGGGVDVTIGDVVADEDTCFLQFSGKATSSTGKPYNNEYVQIFKFRGGKVSSIKEYMDTDLIKSALFSEA